MSKRENIANDIISKLDAVTSPIEFKKITREPFEVEELSDAQFPAMFVQSGDETREVLSIGDTGAGSYRGTIDFLIVAFGKGTTTNIDTVRNQIIEVVDDFNYLGVVLNYTEQIRSVSTNKLFVVKLSRH